MIRVTDSNYPGDGTQPIVSATISNYNYAAFLPRAIESILVQSFSDFELIIIDNASSDDSLEVIRRYADIDERIRIVEHKTNLGPVASFRQSCDLSRGKYRVHVDADDWVISSRSFQRQVEMLESNPGMSFVFSHLTPFDGDGNKIAVAPIYSHDIVLRAEDALEHLLGFNLSHSGMMLRMSAYRQTAGYPDGMPHVDDRMLAVRLAEVGEVGFISDELYAFRRHGDNVHMRPQREVVREEFLPLIQAAFDGPIGQGMEHRDVVRRRVTRTTLLHLPTFHIFNDRYRIGWMLYWESVRTHPLLSVFQRRTVALLARTALGSRGYSWLAESMFDLSLLSRRVRSSVQSHSR